MNELRYCAGGGSVGGGDARIPEDLSEYQYPTLSATVGCNRLKCSSCGAWVRHGPPGLVAKDDVRPHLAEVYEADDWTELPYLEQRDIPSHRLYVCRCSAWAGARDYLMADPDPDPFSQPQLPWRCGGHPTPKLPIQLEETTISSEDDVVDLVDRILGGWCPRKLDEEGKQTPALWLTWTYAYLLGSSHADAFSRACAARLADSDEATVGRVLRFFRCVPEAQGVGDVVDMAATDPKKVTIGYAVPERWDYSTVLDVLIARLTSDQSTSGEIDTRAVEVIQQVLSTPRSKLSRKPAGTLDLPAVYEKALRKKGRSAQVARKLAGGLKDSTLTRLREAPLTLLDDLAGTTAFDESQLRWLADHVIDIEKAWPKRWKAVLSHLVTADRIREEELGHLVVVAGITLVQSGLVPAAKLREWIESSGSGEAWALPIMIAIDKDEKE